MSGGPEDPSSRPGRAGDPSRTATALRARPVSGFLSCRPHAAVPHRPARARRPRPRPCSTGRRRRRRGGSAASPSASTASPTSSNSPSTSSCCATAGSARRPPRTSATPASPPRRRPPPRTPASMATRWTRGICPTPRGPPAPRLGPRRARPAAAAVADELAAVAGDGARGRVAGRRRPRGDRLVARHRRRGAALLRAGGGRRAGASGGRRDRSGRRRRRRPPGRGAAPASTRAPRCPPTPATTRSCSARSRWRSCWRRSSPASPGRTRRWPPAAGARGGAGDQPLRLGPLPRHAPARARCRGHPTQPGAADPGRRRPPGRAGHRERRRRPATRHARATPTRGPTTSCWSAAARRTRTRCARRSSSGSTSRPSCSRPRAAGGSTARGWWRAAGGRTPPPASPTSTRSPCSAPRRRSPSAQRLVPTDDDSPLTIGATMCPALRAMSGLTIVG